jgi:hypothetical protein
MAFLSIQPALQDRTVYATLGNAAVSAVTGTPLVVRPGARSVADTSQRRNGPARNRTRESATRGVSAYAVSEPLLRGVFYDHTV